MEGVSIDDSFRPVIERSHPLKKFVLTTAALASLFCLAPASAGNPGDLYGVVRLLNGDQRIGGQERYSPRALGVVQGPSGDARTNGALAIGTYLPYNMRIEVEYVLPQEGRFASTWRWRNPANGFSGTSLNTVEMRNARLMFNLYKDFPLNAVFSANVGLGLGMASIQAQGWQNTGRRRFDSDSRHNLAWSATLGLQAALTSKLALGVGYRYVDLGQYRTGPNRFLDNASGARDERHGGRLGTRDLFVEMRAAF